MLFNFTLAPLAGFAPRSHPGNPGISWFDLTRGEYWLHAGASTLLEYGERAQAAGAPRHCTYPVARLHEDFLDMLPYILEPVPAALIPCLSGAEGATWGDAAEARSGLSRGSLHDATLHPIEGDVYRLLHGRLLDTSYLAPLTRIAMWSDDENVHFAWDNRAGVLHGHPAWAAQYGEFQMPRREFLAEVQSFHIRLIEQMAVRVEAILSGALPPEVEVDREALACEQAERADALHDALALRAETDWDRVERAIASILQAREAA